MHRELHPRISEVLNMPWNERVDGWRAVANDRDLPNDVRDLAARCLREASLEARRPVDF